MSKTVTFYFSLLSPWVYMAGPRLHEIAQQAHANVAYRPIDLLRVFRETGGTPLAALSPARREYRAVERRRWSRYLGMPISEQPRHHPVDESLAAGTVLAAERAGLPPWPLAQAVLAGVWVRDLDISDPAALARIADEAGYPGKELVADGAGAECQASFDAHTRKALAGGIFGVPSFVVDGELFFGQDRLDFVRRALTDD
ncbi:2-hydroxychromene-2-carboxylate isomerase [Pigmentiphaga humi]|uniref:2-hydroxychromene-2-carboxylate isomerase n=1 Tax=Pigmentiphaga humi TaxID=2478468 RepID=A0A3P4AWH2_9BURK|nr:2-hydroxychromene-2-carboxylate isomerase [Pigmentiphaga humi]VCU68072.1 2-hydroxychromene-2-carboxylate isomerase [Pigmentiphaga humi]